VIAAVAFVPVVSTVPLLAPTARMPGPLLPFGPTVAAVAFVLVAPMVALALLVGMARSGFRLGFSSLPCRFRGDVRCRGWGLRATALAMPRMMVAAATLTAFLAAVAARTPNLFVFDSGLVGRSLVPGCRDTLGNVGDRRRCNVGVGQRTGRRIHGLRNQGWFGRKGITGRLDSG